MDRKGGTATIALVLATVLGVSFIPRQGSDSASPGQDEKRSTQKPAIVVNKSAQQPEKKAAEACGEITKRLRRFATGEIPNIQSCYNGSAPRSVNSSINPDVHFVIAIVPNPVQTHLPLMFDRSIESIQQAAQDMNFIYDSAWFPWSQSDKDYQTLADQEQADSEATAQQQQPGVLVFRRGYDADLVNSLYGQCKGRHGEDDLSPECAKLVGENDLNIPYKEGLVVFVVGEQPTGGISDTQFQNAVQWMQTLQPKYKLKPLRILGPTFSGTLPSLALRLNTDTLKNFPKGLEIYSGSVNSEASVRWFKLFLVQQSERMKGQVESMEFRTFYEGDSLMTDRFLAYLQDGGYRLDRVAILSEDETAFGRVTPAGHNHFRFLDALKHPVAGGKIYISPLPGEHATAGHKPVTSRPPAAKRVMLDAAGSADIWISGPSRVELKDSQEASQWVVEVSDNDQLVKTGHVTTLEPEVTAVPLPINLYYPRDIATLRSAYQRQGIFTAGKQTANAPTTTLRGDLSENASGDHDAVRTYAGQLTPLAQEAALLSITSILETKHIEFVIVRSTNSLDQLFLSEFLRRSYPSGRIVLDGSDLLFRRGMEGASLRGVMLLSPYPLMSWTQDIIPPLNLGRNGEYQFDQKDYMRSPPPKSSYRVFSEDLSEGIYIAARELFPFPEGNRESAPISDYAPPLAAMPRDRQQQPTQTQNADCQTKSSDNSDDPSHHNRDNRRPLTWISVVGHRQFWSIAMLNSVTQQRYPNPNPSPDSQDDRSLLKPERECGLAAVSLTAASSGTSSGTATQKLSALRGFFSHHGPGFPGEMLALLIFSALFGTWHLLLCWKGSLVGTPRARSYFAPVPHIQHPVLIFIGSLIVGLLGLTLAASTGLRETFGQQFWAGSWILYLAVTVLWLVAAGFLGVVKNFELPVSSGATRDLRQAPQDHSASLQGSTGTVEKTSADQRMRVKRKRVLRAWLLAASWLLTLVILAAVRYQAVNSRLYLANLVPTIWRNVHFRSGVSALLPQVLLIAGMYGWFWYSLRGLALFGCDRPVLPSRDSLPDLMEKGRPKPVFESVEQSEELHQRDPNIQTVRDGSEMRAFRMFSQDEAGATTEEAALPLSRVYLWSLLALFIATYLACWAALGETNLRTLGDHKFGSLIFLLVTISIAAILADTVQFLRTWARLRQLLVFLDRLRLRRTLSCLKGLSWESVWSMSGNVMEERYRLISRQFESMKNLQNRLADWCPDENDAEEVERKRSVLAQLGKCEAAGFVFAKWYVKLMAVPDKRSPAAHSVTPNPDTSSIDPCDLAPMQHFQESLAATAGRVLTCVLMPEWQKETHSLNLQPAAVSTKEEDDDKSPAAPAVKPYVRAAEEFFLLPYLGFIQNTLGRIRTIVFSILTVFVAATLAMSSYPFDPLPILGAIFLILFVIVGGTIVFVYAEMHRDATLSHITNTNPGELGMDFWVRIFTYGLGPLIGLLTTLFPSLTDFVVSFLQPGTQAMK